MFEKYYCVKQHDITDCGAACLATISKQYGLKISISKIREAAGTDRQGTNAYGIIRAAEQLGFSAKGVKGDKEAFFSEIPLPCIAHMVIDGELLHYVVVHKITKKQIIIADPRDGIIKLTPEEFFGETETGGGVQYQWSGILVIMVPTTTFQKGDETKGLFQRFFHLLLPQKKLVCNVFSASILYTLLGIAGAFYFKFLIDDILTAGLYNTLHVLSIGVILLNTFKTLLGGIRTHLLLYLTQKLDLALLLGYYNHVLELPMNFFGTRRVGEIVSRFQDASNVRDAISGVTLTFMIDTFMVLFGGILLFLQSQSLFGVTLLIVVFYFMLVTSFNRWYKKFQKKQMESNAQLTSYMVESLNGIQTIKAVHGERKVKLETEIKFVRLLRSFFRLNWLNNLQNSLIEWIELVGGILILWIGGCNVIAGSMSMGQLITFYTLLGYFLEPMKNLMNLQPKMQAAIVAAERLGEILDLEVEKTEQEQHKIFLESLTGDIRMQNVTFRYGTREPVLKDISLQIKQGQRVGLVGESGSGKTTLAKLLLQLYIPEQGDILIGDNNIKDIQIETLRSKIAYISQETFLFSGSILENLTFGLQNVGTQEVIEASKKAQAYEFINALPLRYETKLEENGFNLSGGQRQRLAIARAILRNPDILILDEATSHLDNVTEKAIENILEEYSKNKITIVIAHRLSTIKKCNTIYVMEKGKITEEGTHTELLKKGGLYAKLQE